MSLAEGKIEVYAFIGQLHIDLIYITMDFTY